MNKNFFRSRLSWTALLPLIVLAGLILCYTYQYYWRDNFRPGAAIASIDVAGADKEQAERLLAQQLESIKSVPIIFTYEDSEDKTELSALIKPVNIEETVAAAWAEDRAKSWYRVLAGAFLQRTNNHSLPLEYEPAALNELLNKWNDQWAVPFRDARLEMDKSKGLIVVPGQVGKTVDEKATFKVLPVALGYIPESISGKIVMAYEYPKIDEETLSNMGEIASYTTRYNVNEVNRTHNLTKATNGINGSIVPPGQVFSFNQTVGRRTMESGYKDAMVIVNGKFEPGLGGGICQVSSTLYNACLLAGVKITERHNHNLTVAYVPLGQDATVAYGIQDFKFKNDTTSPLYLRAVAGGGYLTVNIYGDMTFKKKIAVSNQIESSTEYNTVTLEDASLQPGETKVDHNGQNGYVVSSYRTFYDSSGSKIKTEPLGKSRYIALDKTILTGPPAEEPPIDPAEEVPPPPDGQEPLPPPAEVGTDTPVPEEETPPATTDQQPAADSSNHI
ncbi:MAG TPA: VanW family protein [Syntrophomonas sp.]|nr:VanW family protein [Syntrophomonas sp.]